jgi:hypothetical protein
MYQRALDGYEKALARRWEVIWEQRYPLHGLTRCPHFDYTSGQCLDCAGNLAIEA